MLKQNVSFDEIYDKFAIRIIYNSDEKNEKFDAWKIYSLVTDFYTPNPLRLRDWITQPKTTGYEALHTTVMGPLGRWVEVQVRSRRMDEIAEKGYAAHYKYKHGNIDETGLEMWLNKLKETLENPEIDAVDFVEDFKLNLYADEIFVFTPKGEIKSLPANASALDFAFAIHTDIGLRCRGAKLNGKLTPLDTTLKSGDQVEILTTNIAKPNARWLEFVVTARARTKIRTALKEQEKKIAEDGKFYWLEKLRHLKLNLNEKIITEMVLFFKFNTSFELFYRLGNGSLDNKDLKDFISQRNNKIFNFFKNKIKEPNKNQLLATIKMYPILTNWFGKEEEKINYTLSKCCNPIPGDKVFGFISINEGIKVHKFNCPNSISLQSKYAYRIIKAKWIDSTKQEFKITLEISGEDRRGLVNDVTVILNRSKSVNMLGINLKAENNLFVGQIEIELLNKNQLQKIIGQIKDIEGIKKVVRTK